MMISVDEIQFSADWLIHIIEAGTANDGSQLFRAFDAEMQTLCWVKTDATKVLHVSYSDDPNAEDEWAYAGTVTT